MKTLSGLLCALVFLFGIHSNAICANWNATYYATAPHWNSDYASGTVIWSSASTGVDNPVWENKSGTNTATFSVSSSNMMTHLHTDRPQLGVSSDLLYGWSVHTILELNGLLPGESAQVSISGLFNANTKTKVYVGLCPHWGDDAQAWVQVGGNLIATVENIYVDQWVDYLDTQIDGDWWSCPHSPIHEEINGQKSNTFDLFGGNSFTAGNGFKVELISNIYISSYIDPGRWQYEHPGPLALAEGYGNQFSYEVKADVGVVPTPSALLLLGSGLIGLVGFRRKLRRH